MKNYSKYIISLVTFAILITSCDIDDKIENYEESLVVFASITAGFPVIDTVYISKTASINEDITTGDLKISDAEVILRRVDTNEELKLHSIGDGKYVPVDLLSDKLDSIILYWSNYIIEGGVTYNLIVTHNNDSLIATTTIPQQIEIEPAMMNDHRCPDNSYEPVPIIDVNNLNSISPSQLVELYTDPKDFIVSNNINVDSVSLKIGDCFTKSFADYPLFAVDYENDDYNTIQIISTSLESNDVGLEPYIDENLNGTYDIDEDFSDRNRNGIRDSCYINLIYNDTPGLFDNDSLVYNKIANIWKSNLRRGSSGEDWKLNSPYRTNPWLWNVDVAPTNIMWLYFDYYGYYLMTFKATSESYFNYFSGDPVGQNIYLLPDSNIEGGLGVFYSSSSTSFLVKILQE